VFGYATFLLTRGFFNHSVVEILAGIVVGAVFGSALLASLVPHGNVSWQGHLCGGIAGIIAAWLLSRDRQPGPASPGAPGRALTG
jgi:membrane associated rhomboid family serine protease